VAGLPACFLDRDGVLNWMLWHDGEWDSPLGPEEVTLLPGVPEALRRLREVGLALVIVTNQPAHAQGKAALSRLQATQAELERQLAAEGIRLDGVYTCYHRHKLAVVPELNVDCDCRKPKPGLLLQAEKVLGLDLGRSFMVGDGRADIQAGQAAGCRTILIQALTTRPTGLRARPNQWRARPEVVVRDLGEAAEWIAGQRPFTTETQSTQKTTKAEVKGEGERN